MRRTHIQLWLARSTKPAYIYLWCESPIIWMLFLLFKNNVWYCSLIRWNDGGKRSLAWSIEWNISVVVLLSWWNVHLLFTFPYNGKSSKPVLLLLPVVQIWTLVSSSKLVELVAVVVVDGVVDVDDLDCSSTPSYVGWNDNSSTQNGVVVLSSCTLQIPRISGNHEGRLILHRTYTRTFIGE